MANILIVEDEEISGMTLQMCLEDEGYNVHLATSGQAAISDVETFLPDVLISDWRLKDEIDGIDVARHLIKLNPDLRVIFCSGMSIEDIQAKTTEMKVWKFFCKPCELDEMLGAVQEAVGGKS